MRFRRTLLALFLITSVALTTMAEEQKPLSKAEVAAKRQLHRYDKDGNGRIEKHEDAKVWVRLRKLDKNRDGALTLEELKAVKVNYVPSKGEQKLEILYKQTSEGKALHLDLYYPTKEKRAAKCPLLVYTHGGGWAAGSKQGAAVGTHGQAMLELLDAGASEAFAVADHQLAHIYVPDPGRRAAVKALVEGLDGVETVLDEEGKRAYGLAHDRAGDLVAISRADRWFTYYYWLDDAKAPDYARTVEIHRKPGYDPVELFMDPAIAIPQLAIAWRLAKKALGFRTLMDVIPLDASLVKGSHGRITDRLEDGPLIISSEADLLPDREVAATDVKKIVLEHIFGA